MAVERFFGIGKRWRASQAPFLALERGLSPLEYDQGVTWHELVRFQEGSPPEQADAAFILTHYLKKYGRRVEHTYQARIPVKEEFKETVTTDELGIPISVKSEVVPTFGWRTQTQTYTILNFLAGFPQQLVDVILTAPVKLKEFIRQGKKEIAETGDSEIADTLIKRDPALFGQFYEKKPVSVTPEEKEEEAKKPGQGMLIVMGSLAFALFKFFKG